MKPPPPKKSKRKSSVSGAAASSAKQPAPAKPVVEDVVEDWHVRHPFLQQVEERTGFRTNQAAAMAVGMQANQGIRWQVRHNYLTQNFTRSEAGDLTQCATRGCQCPTLLRS